MEAWSHLSHLMLAEKLLPLCHYAFPLGSFIGVRTVGKLHSHCGLNRQVVEQSRLVEPDVLGWGICVMPIGFSSV